MDKVKILTGEYKDAIGTVIGINWPDSTCIVRIKNREYCFKLKDIHFLSDDY